MKGLAVIVGIISLVGILHAWSIGDNISSGTDRARAITADDNYIYIAGYDEAPGDLEIRIQKRNKSDGSIVWQRWDNVSSGYDKLYAIANDANYIYTAGFDDAGEGGGAQWRIEKRNKSDGSPVWIIQDDISSHNDVALGITVDDNYIYVVGDDGGPGSDFEIRIQKRRKSDGSIVWQRWDNVSSGYDELYAIANDANYIYTAGFDDETPSSISQWRIEKRNKSDGSPVWIIQDDISSHYDVALGITVDDNYIYIAGYDEAPGDLEIRIQKRNKSDGSIVWQRWNNVSSHSDVLYAITNDGNYIYIAGYDCAPGNSQWRIEKRNKSDGAPVWVQQIDFSPGIDEATGIAADNDYIYLCGSDNIPGSDEWRIEKRNKSDGSVTGIEEERAASFPTLMQIAPNPFSSLTTISYEVPISGKVCLRVYDVTGKLVRTLAEVQSEEPGVYKVTWNGKNDTGKRVPSGVYFYKLTTGGFSIIQKGILR